MTIATDFTASGMAQKALTVTSTSTAVTGTAGLAGEDIPGTCTHLCLQPSDGKVYWNLGTATASTGLVPAGGLVINAQSAPTLRTVQLYSPTGATVLATFGGNAGKVVLGDGDSESYDVGEPFALLIDESVLGVALADPPPVATKAESVAAAAHGIIDTRGKSVARIVFGGTNLADEAFNYQVIAWSRVAGGASEGWLPRVIAKGLVTLGDDVYAITGFGAATNFFADTITDTILDAATVYRVAEQRAVLEVPTYGAERIEVQTDLTTAAAADAFIQLGDATLGGSAGGGGGAAFYEDEAHVSGDPGRMFLCVRKSSRASLAGADGDYAPPQLTDNGDMRTRDDDLNTLLAVGTGAMASAQAVTIATDDTILLAVQKALVGAAAPTIDSYTSAAVNCAAATANQELVAAPGSNKQIWVYGFGGTANVGGSVSLQDEDDTALSGVMPVGAKGGPPVIQPSGNFAMPWFKVATNKALELDTVTCEFDGSISYAIVSV